MKTAELFVRCLENEGVPVIFGIPGEENLDLMDALLDSSLRFIQTRHEQGAAFMANVQGRLTGKASACLATLGPGATNLVTAVADANMDHAPLVAITGQAGIHRLHKESHQVMDLVALFRPLTKYNAQVVTPEIAPEVIRKAFKVAQTHKFGATHIDLPEDVARQTAGGSPLIPQQPKNAEPLASQLARAADVINNASFPVILAGNGVIRADACDALRRFVARTHIPCANTFMAKGVLPYTEPHSLLAVGLQTQDYVSCGFDRADVVICIGYDLVEYHPNHWNPGKNKRIVHIDLTPAEVDEHYQLTVGIEADIAVTLDELVDKLSLREHLAYTDRLRKTILEDLAASADDNGFPLKPQRILNDVRAVMGDDDILISDVGAHKLWIARMYPCMRPNTCIISNGFASMGIGLSGAIGAKLTYPDRRVMTISGDGGFLMNCQELETAVRLRLPVVVLLWRDEAYGVIAWKQESTFGRKSHVDFGNPDFVKLAESFGCGAYRVEASCELRPILQKALAENRPVLVDCPVDYRENLKLTDRLGKLVCPV